MTREQVAVANALSLSVGVLVRRLRQAQSGSDLSLPQTAVLSRLDHGGPATAADLARLEQISQQSIGATLAELESRGLVAKTPHPDDRRAAVISPTKVGLAQLRDRRNARTQLLAAALEREFTARELQQLKVAAPLLERLAQTL